ncbi:MAG TPA: (2Fe-2S)-binding protein [Polyangia bacterium]|nr:(2Fe-2S)-binding protein [Polyangia bacterium]
MAAKTIVCRCEDVTLADVEHTLALGYRSVEEVKRYTGLGTGPCQGKECMLACALLCLRAGAEHAEPFTSRPPVGPISLGALARADEEAS